TTFPCIGIVSNTVRIALVAASSASFLLPLPTHLADESAAASDTRTNSIVKLLSIMLRPSTYVLINGLVIESFLFHSILHGVFLHHLLPLCLLYFHIRLRYLQFTKSLFVLQPVTP